MFHLRTRRHSLIAHAVFILCAGALLIRPASADYVQQGLKLVGTNAIGASAQGASVAISADGNTAIVGAPGDYYSTGAAWIYVRSNGAWVQQGGKLVASDIVPQSYPQEGTSVAISADGNTVIMGGVYDGGNSQSGAAWIFVRSNGTWSQQGNKLVGTGGAYPYQGIAVALSADGNTALIGGASDQINHVDVGAAWVFVRNAGTWSQQGNKLVGTGYVGESNQGISVSLSADGNTALIGGASDNSNAGAAWVFTRSAGVWSQYGNKLVVDNAVGTVIYLGRSVALSSDGKTAALGATGDANFTGATWIFTLGNAGWTQQSKIVSGDTVNPSAQGNSVSLSADGDTLLIGAYGDADRTGVAYTGAALVFHRSNGVWTQYGPKLVGTSAAGAASQGISVALSADGSAAIVGGYTDSSNVGAAWAWSRRTTPHDFNGDAKSDIVWRNSTGDNAMWLMNGATIASVAGLPNVPTNWYVVGQRDFNGDGKTDLLWASTTGDVAIWLMNGSTITSVASLGNVGANWGVAGTADFNGDGKGDILWRSTAGDNAIWFMNGTTLSSIAVVGNVPTNWTVVGTADFNADGKGDILWRNSAGDNAIWLMNGATISSVAGLGNVPVTWAVVGTADFNGDGKGDIMWRNSGGDNAIWLMNGTTIASVAGLGNIPTNWSVVSNGDYNGDGNGDILWRNTAGDNAIWFMNGTTLSSISGLGNVPTNWTIQNMNAN